MLSLIHSKFNHPDAILNMDFEDGFSIIESLIKSIEKEKLWQLYLSVYPSMCKKELKFMTFEEFSKPQKIDVEISNKTDEEILNDVLEIRRRMNQNG